MGERIIEISGLEQTFLRLEKGQIHLEREGAEPRKFPAEDTAAVIIDSQRGTVTKHVLTELMLHNAAVVVCDDKHLPAGILLPVVGNSVMTERFRTQVEATAPTRKRVWAQLVREKIERQADALNGHAAARRLRELAKRVRSGDGTGAESVAARAYWSAFWPAGIRFRREREGAWPNPLLNYGYIVMRAAVARAIVAAGFHPSLGVSHSNRYNPFCLADDLLEPFRPLVDVTARRLCREGVEEIDKESKRALLSLLHWPTRTRAGTGPLIKTLEPYVASLHHAFSRRREKLDIPAPDLALAESGSC